MKILFLTITNIKSIKNKSIYTDLLRYFVDCNHEVFIISPVERKYKTATKIVQSNNTKILRVKIGNYQKTNIIEKGLTLLRIDYLFLKAFKKYFTNYNFDLVIYSTPPISFVKTLRYLKETKNIETYLLLKDIFPQNAVDLKMLSKTNPLYWLFRKKEKKLYKISDYIGCMSEANVDFILKENPEVHPAIVEVCPNSIDPVSINVSKIDKEKIKIKYNIPETSTIFIYGGNLGKPQGIDFVIECVKKCSELRNAYFLIVGSGTEFNKLKLFYDKEKPANSQLLSQLPKEDYQLLANSCDVGLIFLDHRFTIPNFPSRLLSYMQASIPVLAATDPNTDIGKIIEDGNFGYWCESNNSQAFYDLVVKLCDKDLREQMGRNARKYLENNYTVKHSYDVIMKHFQN